MLIAYTNKPLIIALTSTHTHSHTRVHTATALTDLDTPTINKLLTALNECTEWGQVFILDSLATYQPKEEKEGQSICERVTPRLSHANAAVVLSAVKVSDNYNFISMVRGSYRERERSCPPVSGSYNFLS